MMPVARICFCTSLRCKTRAFLRTASPKPIDLLTKQAQPAMEGRKPATSGGQTPGRVSPGLKAKGEGSPTNFFSRGKGMVFHWFVLAHVFTISTISAELELKAKK